MRAASCDKTTPIKLPTKRKNSSQKRDEVEELMITELKEIQERRTAKELTDDEGYFGQHVLLHYVNLMTGRKQLPNFR